MAKDRRRRRNSGRPPKTKEQNAQAALDRGTPNERVTARQNLFRHFMGDKAIGHEMTCAGRLMIVGAFDGLELAPETILSALLDYSRAYWGNYGGGPQVAEHGRIKVDGGAGPVAGIIDPETGKLKDGAGDWFEARDTLLREAGAAERKAVHTISVNRHWFPDENADWADRIINRRILDKRKQLISAGQPVPSELRITGELDCDSDWAMLALARAGAMVLAEGANKRKLAA